MIKIGAALAGALAAAFGASLCCLGPLLAVFAGIGGAGLASTFEPLRPYLLAASAALFVVGGLALYRRPGGAACDQAGACAPSRPRPGKALFWVAVALAAVLASFPVWSKLLV